MNRRERRAAAASGRIGTVAAYGPDDKTITKLVAAIVVGGKAENLRRWVGTGVHDNPKVQAEVKAFLKAGRVRRVVASPGVMGCPHESPDDFPVGGDCPFCPFWKGKQ